jgi:ATP-dependent Clp protease ATP-binding subunit ClpA
MFERFTQAAREVVLTAQSTARAAGHREIGAQDVLAGVLADEQGPVARVLRDLR